MRGSRALRSPAAGAPRLRAARNAAAAGILIACVACGGGGTPGDAADATPEDASQATGTPGEEAALPGEAIDPGVEGGADRVNIVLYFMDQAGELAPEMRRWPAAEPPAVKARRLIEALVQGPREGLHRTLPKGTEVRAVHLGSDGTAYVDLDQTFSRGLSSGSRDALVAVRSLVETLATNIPECTRVKILVEGEEVRELGGHLDLTHPVAPESAPTDRAPDGAHV